MKLHEQLEAVTHAIKDHDESGVLSDIDPTEITQMVMDFEVKPDKYKQMIGTVVYLRKRLVDNVSRQAAFKAAFPERSIATEKGDDSVNYARTTQLGEELHGSTLSVKAKRLENSKLYKQLYTVMQTNLYAMYAVERIRVLDEALRMSLDPHVADRDKPQYMKLFLEETRKPAEAAKMELSMQVTHNTMNVVSVEDKMNTIAQAMQHATAAEVIEMVHKGKLDGSTTEN